MKFQYDLEPVIVQWILIDLKAILKKIIYCRYCDRLTKKQVEQINKKSIDLMCVS